MQLGNGQQGSTSYSWTTELVWRGMYTACIQVQSWMVVRVSLHSLCGFSAIWGDRGTWLLLWCSCRVRRAWSKGYHPGKLPFSQFFVWKEQIFLGVFVCASWYFWLWVSLLSRLGYVGDENKKKNPKELTS